MLDDQSKTQQVVCVIYGHSFREEEQSAGVCPACGERLALCEIRNRIGAQARMSVVIGLLSLLLIPIFGPFAIHYGNKSFRAARNYHLRGIVPAMAIGGMILGIASLIVLATVIAAFLFMMTDV